MNRFRLIILAVMLTLLALASAAGSAPAAPEPGPPTLVSYQGHVMVEGAPYTGKGYFKFAIVDTLDTIHWANDDTLIGGEPEKSVALEVTNGLFSVLLGDITLSGMSEPLTAKAFEDGERYLRVWFSTDSAIGFTQLKEDRRIAATPYALVAQEAVHALDADTLQGSGAGDFQQHYAHVIVVAQSGGDFATITAALGSITSASDTNRYLVWVAPGTYDEQVTMKQYVDIAGAGELITRVRYIGSDTFLTGTVVGANYAELRDLTVENTGGAEFAYATAILNSELVTGFPHLTRVTAIATGGSNKCHGVQNYYASPVMTDVSATASGSGSNIGVYNYQSSSQMTAMVAAASGGADSYNYGVIDLDSATTMTNVTATASGEANSHNYGVYSSTSDTVMTNVTATATSAPGVGGWCIGVYNGGDHLTTAPYRVLTGVTATASGCVRNYGVENGNSSPLLMAVTATASGGSEAWGVYNQQSAATIRDSTLSATGGTQSRGVCNLGWSERRTVKIDNSRVAGSSHAIYNDAEFDTFVGASQLDGAVANLGDGTVTCAGVYNGAYVFYASTCP